MKIVNMALLAKQGWHILQNLESVLSWALRGGYYPGCSFMDATLGGYVSYA